MIATDVAARGLDIKGVQNVIHYQIPRTAEVCHHFLTSYFDLLNFDDFRVTFTEVEELQEFPMKVLPF